MSNLPIPTADTAISGLHQIDTPLTIDDLLIISIKLTAGYYTGKITLEQIKTFFLNNTTPRFVNYKYRFYAFLNF